MSDQQCSCAVDSFQSGGSASHSRHKLQGLSRVHFELLLELETSLSRSSEMDQASEPLQKVQLFGGAAEIALPSRFADVSNIRPVPDNQEVEKRTVLVSLLRPITRLCGQLYEYVVVQVYTDANIDQSLIVEIVVS